MKNVSRIVELTANVSIIIVAVLLGVVLVRSYLSPAGSAERTIAAYKVPKTIQTGDTIDLPGIDWRQNKQTLLLVLSTSCHFCTESAPFYQRISSEHGDTRLVALLPQDVNEGELYLKKVGVQVDEIKQASLSAIGFKGTPTLVLIDDGGRVKSIWEGLLPPDSENEVIRKLLAETANN